MENLHNFTERELTVLFAAARPKGVLIPNNLGWRACVADELHSRKPPLLTKVCQENPGVRGKDRFRWAITEAGRDALGLISRTAEVK